MSVYVDPLQPTLRNQNWPYDEGCHLLADTIEELHVFATINLRMKKSWFQNPQNALPHYDLTKGKRFQAIAKGAIEIDIRRVAQMMKDRRALNNAASGIP